MDALSLDLDEPVPALSLEVDLDDDVMYVLSISPDSPYFTMEGTKLHGYVFDIEVGGEKATLRVVQLTDTWKLGDENYTRELKVVRV